MNGGVEYEFLLEPVEEWMTVEDTGCSILDHFYTDKKAFAFAFQMQIMLSQYRQIKCVADSKILISERGPFANPIPYLMAELGFLNSIELRIYKDWCKVITSEFDICGVVYIRTTPEECMSRIMKRNRYSEEKIILEYLKEIHDAHERMFAPAMTTGLEGAVPVIVLDGMQDTTTIAKTLREAIPFN